MVWCEFLKCPNLLQLRHWKPPWANNHNALFVSLTGFFQLSHFIRSSSFTNSAAVSVIIWLETKINIDNQSGYFLSSYWPFFNLFLKSCLAVYWLGKTVKAASWIPSHPEYGWLFLSTSSRLNGLYIFTVGVIDSHSLSRFLCVSFWSAKAFEDRCASLN